MPRTTRPNLYGKSKLNNLIKNIEDAKREKTVEERFLDDLNATICKLEDLNKRQSSLTYKPSGMQCMRHCFYFLSNLPVPEEVRTYSSIGICESGTDRHERIQKAIASMREMGFDCDYIDVETYIKQHNLEDTLTVVEKQGMETKILNKKLNMSFLTDGIIRYRGVYYIFEFKTEISRKWYKRTYIDPVHMSQAAAYSENFGIPDVIFVYENRDTCEKKSYMFHVTDEDRKNRITGFIEECNNYIANRIVPPMPIDTNTLTKCKYCEFKARCAMDGLGSKQLLLENKVGEVT